MGSPSRPEALFRTQVFGMQTLWGLLYLIVVAVVIYACFGNRHYDDPYITYRYAQNLSTGIGFVYNAGERVLSTTTPLFALVLAALNLITQDIPAMANLIGAFCLAASALCLHDLAVMWRQPIAGRFALCAYPGFPLLIATLGSELPLYILLCLLSFWCGVRGRAFLAVLFIALATITRSDGALAAITLFVWMLSDSGQRATSLRIWKYVGTYTLLILVWYGFAWWYYGSLLPATLFAKQAQGALPISTGFFQGILTVAKQSLTDSLWWVPVTVMVIGIYAIIRNRSGMCVALIWAGFHLVSYTLLGVSRYFWYYAPLVPAFVIAMGVGIERISSLPGSLTPRFRNGVAVILVAICLSVIGTSLLALAVAPDRRVEIYQAAGSWLRDNTTKGESVGALEVGALGYYSERPMIDFAGLIQPDVAREMWQARNYDDTALYAIARYKPDYIVYREAQAGVDVIKVLESHCSIAQQFEGRRYPLAGDLTIYRCHYDNS